MALGDVLARLSVVLSLDSAAFSTGTRKAAKDAAALGDRAEAMGNRIGRAGKAIAGVAVAVAGTAVVATVKDLVESGLEYASALGEQAQQLGVTTKSLQEYRYAATQVGLSQDEMDASLAKLTRTMGEAAEGAKSPSAAFDKLGIDIKGFVASGKDAGDLLPLIADGLQKIPSPAERAALMVDLFGKSGQKLAPLLADGSKGINNLRDAAQRLGIVLSEEQIRKADETADKLAQLKTVLSARIASAVSDNADSILELVNALIKLVEYAGKAARAWRIYVSAVAGGKSVEQVARDEVGKGVELTFTPEELAARKRAAQRGQRAPAPARSGGTILLRNNPSTYRGGLGPLTTGLADPRADRFGTPGKGLANLAALGVDLDTVGNKLDDLGDVANDNEGRIRTTTVRIAESFRDMAEATLASISRLTSAIKGGGFLGILEAVIGLGLQLGSSGLFGKKLADRINNPRTPPIKGYAGGTLSAPRGLALVGERGPELVNFRGGERVWKNGQGPGSAARVQIVPSRYFDAVVDGRIVGASPSIMDGSYRVTQRKQVRAASRRLAYG